MGKPKHHIPHNPYNTPLTKAEYAERLAFKQRMDAENEIKRLREEGYAKADNSGVAGATD